MAAKIEHKRKLTPHR